MRLRHSIQTSALIGALALATPALAHDAPIVPQPGVVPANLPVNVDARPVLKVNAPLPQQPAVLGPEPRAREAWLTECRRRLVRRDNGLGGGIVGGLLGGLLGNRIAGRGNRTTGTIVGGVAGAVAGVVIDKAEDAGRGQSADYCEAYLDDYYARNAQAYGYMGQGMAYAAPVPVALVPVATGYQAYQAAGQGACTETVTTTEYVEEVPVRRRHIQRRAVPDKRVRIVPDKRVPAN
ncbi:MAG: hypothetical protein RIQ46_1742 [Pseudomonadota bacterium]|jgi:hypothetical protein